MDTYSYQFPFDADVKSKADAEVQVEIKVERGQKPFQRSVVCEHWIYGLCQLNTECKFLHMYDVNKMPICRRIKNGFCKVKYCPFKHGDSDTTECVFYKQGFCYRGKDCKNHHVIKLKDECPSEASFELNMVKKIKVADPNENMKVTLCSMNLVDPIQGCRFGADKCHYAHGEDDIREGQQYGNEMLVDDEIYDPTRNRLDANLTKKSVIIRLGGNREINLDNNPNVEYFLIQAPDLPTLAKARRLEFFQVPRKTAEDLNAAFRRADHVCLLFSVRLLKGLYGLARLDGPVPMPVIGTDFSREFPIQWMRTFRISMRTVAQMKTGVTGLHIGKARGDCPISNVLSDEERRNDKSYHDILRIAYRKPEWDWTLSIENAIKVKGVRVVFPTGLSNVGSSVSSAVLVAAAASADGSGTNTSSNSMMIEDSTLQPSSTSALVPLDGAESAEGSDQLFSPYWIKEIIRASYEMPSKTGRTMQKTTFYKGDSCGFMFCASGATIDEMFSKKLFGLPPHVLDSDRKIDIGAPIFILNTDQNLYGQQGNDIYGIFQAVSGLSNEPLDPTAFLKNGRCEYPLQLRVECVVNMDFPLKHSDPDVAKAVSSGKFGGPLSLNETIHLCEVFAHRAGLVSDLSQLTAGMASAGMGGGFAPGMGAGGLPNVANLAGGFPGRVPPKGAPTQGEYYKPQFPYYQDVPEGGISPEFNLYAINGIKRKVLGAEKASNLSQIIRDSGGNFQNSRIRIRGIHSGFPEGPIGPNGPQELQVPLFFTVSADSEALLKNLVTRLQAAITQAVNEQRNMG